MNKLRVAYYRYRLIPKAGGKPREGALLRANGGYADLCPLSEFGDESLDTALNSIVTGEPNELLLRALNFTVPDSHYRSEGKSALAGLPPHENHALLPILSNYTSESLCTAVAGLWERGFRVFKIKIAHGDLEQEAQLLNTLVANASDSLLLRLDPNARFTPESCRQFLDRLTPETRAQIEFIEDPTPFAPSFWRTLYKDYGIPLAADFEVPPYQEKEPSYQVRILKPVRDSLAPLPHTNHVEKIVITSALDHPMGQMQSLFAMGILSRSLSQTVSPVCGIASHLVYEENPFSAQLRMDGSRLIPPLGTGWGFDDLLEALPWTDLN